MDIDSVTFRPQDGNEIAFRAVVDGKFGVYAINIDGSNFRPILEPTVGSDVDRDHAASMAFSPDGKKLFYQSWQPASDGWVAGRVARFLHVRGA